jgi:hypothetical protein
MINQNSEVRRSQCAARREVARRVSLGANFGVSRVVATGVHEPESIKGFKSSPSDYLVLSPFLF